MIHRWIQDIREKTKEMAPAAKREYIWQYYRYHMLFICLGIILLLMTGWHLLRGRQPVAFRCVLVNQQTDFERDEKIKNKFAAYAGLPAEAVSVSSDYQFSYKDVRYEGVNESSYEKFFFAWAAGEIDAMLVPESLCRFCMEELEGRCYPLDEMLTESLVQSFSDDGTFYFHKERPVGIYAARTALAGRIQQRESDPVILLFPKEGRHPETGARFVEMIAGKGKI